MKTIKTIILVTILSMSLNSFAQWGYGGMAGLTFAKIAVSDIGDDVKAKVRTSFTLGGYATYEITEEIDLMGSFMFSGRGSKYELTGSSVKPTIKISYINIPIYAVYNYEIGSSYPEMYIQAYAGPYLGFGLTAKQTDVDIFDEISRFDFGLDFGVGFQYDRYKANLTYSLGLTNIAPNIETGTAKNRVLSFTLGYVIGSPDN